MDALRRLTNDQLRLLAFGLLSGLILGYLFGGYLARPAIRNAGPQHLASYNLDQYVDAVANAYSRDANPAIVKQAFCYWDGQSANHDRIINDLQNRKAASTNPGAFNGAYDTVINALGTGANCNDYVAANAGVTGGTGFNLGNLLNVFLILGLLVGLGLLALWALTRRPQLQTERPIGSQSQQPSFSRPAATTTAPAPVERRTAPPPAAAPARRSRAAQPEITPVAGFETTYVHGDDDFDKSFIIENANSDFLGECGVSISESIGSNGGRNVTAFEIWLFDKTDTHTVTKVVMSDHAFGDEGFRAKLAPRGEPVAAREGDTIALETASLIINATLRETAYTRDSEFPRSVFDRFTAELSAWVKSDDAGGGRNVVSGSPDDALAF